MGKNQKCKYKTFTDKDIYPVHYSDYT